ncbi:MAG: DUF2723 domain-containing protein [Anaerolineae bacterium]|nr:DUF2723 domain-containing protein [Chloroflexota bacterium]
MADTVARPAPEAQGTASPWPEAAIVLGLGLYLARMGAESLTGTRSWAQLTFLVLTGLVLAWFITRGLKRLELEHRELGLLWVYVLWPGLNTTAGLSIGLLSVGVWLWRMRPIPSPRLVSATHWVPEVVIASLALLLYWDTLSPSILPADAGEFQLVGSTLGIAHPPGYPLYTLLAKLATLAPVPDHALPINAMSAIFATATLVVIMRLVRQVTPRPSSPRGIAWAAALAGCALIVSPTYWTQATTANIRSLTGLFTAALLWLAVRYTSEPTTRRLAALLFVLGLACGHHSSLVLLILSLGPYLLLSRGRSAMPRSHWLWGLGALLASTLVLAYLPIRSAMKPSFDPVPVDSLARFLDHVLALGFRGDVLYLESARELLERLVVYVQILRLQFGPWLPWAMLLSLGAVCWRNRRLGLLLGGVWAVNALSAITYRAPQTVEYLIPSYVAMAASLGCGLMLVVERMPHRRRTGLIFSLVSALLILQILPLLPDMRLQPSDVSTRTGAEKLLRLAPNNALVLANWHNATPLWYLQQVEGERPDVRVDYVYPQGSRSNAEVWLQRIQQALPFRPVVVTTRFHEYEGSGLLFEPLGSAWLVRAEPSESPPDAATRVAAVLGERIRIDAISAPDTGTPGDTLTVHLYWHPTVQLTEDYAVFVQLIGPDGLVGQADRAQPTSTYAVGAMRADSYDLPLLLQTAPGSYQLIAGFYTQTTSGWERLLTATGEDFVQLGTVTVRSGTQQAPSLMPCYRTFEEGVILTGVDIDRSIPGTTRVYLHWTRPDTTPTQPARVALEDAAGATLAEGRLPAIRNGQVATVALDLEGAPELVQLRLTTPSGVETRRPLSVFRLPGAETLSLKLPEGAWRYVPLGGEFAWVQRAEHLWRVRPGRPAAIRPELLALRPIRRDISLSVSIVSAGNTWEVKADGTPALGAIPTLKWLTGWRVTSLYMPQAPEDAAPGDATVRLEAYDAFTLAPLAVLDERLVRQGQGTYVVMGSAQILAH